MKDAADLIGDVSFEPGVLTAIAVDVARVLQKHAVGVHLPPWDLWEAKLRRFYRSWIKPFDIPWLPDRILDSRLEERWVQFWKWLYGKLS